MLFFISKNGSNDRLAASPKAKLIKPTHIDTEDTPGISSHRSTYFNVTTVTPVRILGEIIVTGLVVMLPLSAQAGFFAKFFKAEEAKAFPIEDNQTNEAVDIPLLSSQQNPNPMGAKGGAEIFVDDNVLVSTGPVGEDEIAEQRSSLGEIRVYTVREGDSLSQISEMFGVTANTIMWANDITKANQIQPGDSLVILPIAGVRHTVKSGETVSTIAKKYEGNIEEILSYNQLDSADQIAVGDELIIPGGALHSAPARVVQAQPVSVSGTGSASASGFSHPSPGSVKTQGIHGYNAVDLAGGHGSVVRSAAAGEVIVSKNSGWNGGYGQYIVVRHSNGAQTLYAHLSRNSVGVGAYVSQGQTIGAMGSTGRSTGTHLHFEVRGARNPF